MNLFSRKNSQQRRDIVELLTRADESGALTLSDLLHLGPGLPLPFGHGPVSETRSLNDLD